MADQAATPNPVPTPAAPAKTEEVPYIPQHFDITLANGQKIIFESVPKYETERVTDPATGKITTTKNRTDFFRPKGTGIDEKLGLIGWIAKLQEAKEKGIGEDLLENQLQKLSEAPNEVLIDDNGKRDYKAFVMEYEKPYHRTALSAAKVKAQIDENLKQLGILFLITNDPDPVTQKEKIIAAGFNEYAQAVARVDQVGQAITKLNKTLAEIKRRQAERDAKKKKAEDDKAKADALRLAAQQQPPAPPTPPAA